MRHQSRETAFKIIYQLDIGKNDLETALQHTMEEDGLNPVSYTHLFPLKYSKRCCAGKENWSRYRKFAAVWDDLYVCACRAARNGPCSVSYTHLDVYKRQGHCCLYGYQADRIIASGIGD